MSNVFERLYHSPTAASKGWKTTKYVAPPDPSNMNSPLNKKSHSNPRSAARSQAKAETPEKLVADSTSADDPVSPITAKPECNSVPAPSIGCPSENECQLLCSDKYSASGKLVPLSPTSLGLARCLESYQRGEASESKVAREIIEALFNRDFMPGERWDIDSATVSYLENENVYKVEKQATWDWKDIYSEASAKGRIRFNPNKRDIRVEDYSYYVAG